MRDESMMSNTEDATTIKDESQGAKAIKDITTGMERPKTEPQGQSPVKTHGI